LQILENRSLFMENMISYRTNLPKEDIPKLVDHICRNGIFQSCNRKIGIDPGRQTKCNDFTRKQIHNRTKIIESTSSSDICKIEFPSHIWLLRFE